MRMGPRGDKQQRSRVQKLQLKHAARELDRREMEEIVMQQQQLVQMQTGRIRQRREKQAKSAVLSLLDEVFVAVLERSTEKTSETDLCKILTLGTQEAELNQLLEVEGAKEPLEAEKQRLENGKQQLEEEQRVEEEKQLQKKHQQVKEEKQKLQKKIQQAEEEKQKLQKRHQQVKTDKQQLQKEKQQLQEDNLQLQEEQQQLEEELSELMEQRGQLPLDLESRGEELVVGMNRIEDARFNVLSLLNEILESVIEKATKKTEHGKQDVGQGAGKGLGKVMRPDVRRRKKDLPLPRRKEVGVTNHGDPDLVRLKVVHLHLDDPSNDIEIHFNVHPNQPMKKLKEVFTEKVGLTINSLHFYKSEPEEASGPDGRLIEDSDTPAGLGLQDGDYIDVCDDSWFENEDGSSSEGDTSHNRIETESEAALQPSRACESSEKVAELGKKGKSPVLTEVAGRRKIYKPCNAPECDGLRTFFHLSNISKLGGAEKKVFSDPVYVRNIPWKLLVYKTTDQLSCYLTCFAKTKSRVWSCEADANIILLNHTPTKDGKTRNLVRKFGHRKFTNRANDWGWQSFISWKLVVDPSQGYVTQNGDSLVFDVTIISEAPVGIKLDLESPLKVTEALEDPRKIDDLVGFIENNKDASSESKKQKKSKKKSNSQTIQEVSTKACEVKSVKSPAEEKMKKKVSFRHDKGKPELKLQSCDETKSDISLIKHGGKVERKGSSEGIITFKLSNVSKLVEENIFSEPFHINDLPWKILVYKSEESFSFYVVSDGKRKPKSWRCNANILMILHSKVKNLERNTSHSFSFQDHDWGYKYFHSMEDMINESKGFVEDDSALLEVRLTVDLPHFFRGGKIEKTGDKSAPSPYAEDERDIGELLEFIETKSGKSSKKKSKKKAVNSHTPPIPNHEKTMKYNSESKIVMVKDHILFDNDLTKSDIKSVKCLEGLGSISPPVTEIEEIPQPAADSPDEVNAKESFVDQKKSLVDKMRSLEESFNDLMKAKCEESKIMSYSISTMELETRRLDASFAEAEQLSSQLEGRMTELCGVRRELANRCYQDTNANEAHYLTLELLLEKHLKDLCCSLRDLKQCKNRFSEEIMKKAAKMSKLESKKERLQLFMKNEYSIYCSERRKLLEQ